MRVLLLTDDRSMAERFYLAAQETGLCSLVALESEAELLERMFREAFDALLFDDVNVLRPSLRRCPVLWPQRMYLLERRPMQSERLPDALTFCFPFKSAPKDVLCRIHAFSTGRVRQRDTEVLLSRFLQRIGVPASLSGFAYLSAAIRLLLRAAHPTVVGAIGDVYEILAAEAGTSASVAEHAMRHAIDTAWMRADPEILERVFGNTVQSERAAPSNAAFLFRAAEQIRFMKEGGYRMMHAESRGPAPMETMPERNERMDATINAVMRALCIPPKLLGYRYLFLAVRIVRNSTDWDRAAVKRDLYDRIGACMGTTKPMISRSIRYAVAQAWKHADPEVLRSYLGYAGSLKEPPGNIELVYLIAERVRLILGDPIWEARHREAVERARTRFPWLSD